jgi:YegS/Rv2252/BmrU family lipid kinase
LNASLIVNPIAGNRAFKFTNKIETLLRKRVSLTTCVTKKKGDAYNFTKNIQNTDLIIVASGDGTINEVINGLCSSSNFAARKIPIALVPLGIVNVLAKEIGVPHTIEKAIDLALNGSARKISLGRINGRYFALMAGIGFDGETVLGVKNNIIKKISGKGAHVLSGIKVLKKYKPPLVKIKTPSDELTGYNVVISNARCYGGYFYVTPLASITEPVLDICVFKGKSRKDLFRFIIGVIRNKHMHFRDVSFFRTNDIEITSNGKVHIQIDGDYFGTLPANIDIVKDAVSLIW